MKVEDEVLKSGWLAPLEGKDLGQVNQQDLALGIVGPN